MQTGQFGQRNKIIIALYPAELSYKKELKEHFDVQ